MTIKWLPGFMIAAAAVVALLFATAVFAQGFGGLSGLLGGSKSSGHRSSNAVTVDRGAPPYMGTFTGTQTTSSGSNEVNTKVACYPAHDPAFAQTTTFLCYEASASAPATGTE